MKNPSIEKTNDEKTLHQNSSVESMIYVAVKGT